MKILLIPDKFKGSLTGNEVILALRNGIKKYDPTIEISEIQASDGGDGFLNAMEQLESVEFISVSSVDPLGRKIDSRYAYSTREKVAYIELANASGLFLLAPAERDLLRTSTFGTGLQILDAIDRGAKKIFIGLGGSATNDGGTGIASALGYKFLDSNAKSLAPQGDSLSQISEIISPSRSYKEIEFYAVNDVSNPLFGDNGAALVYGQQKGGDSKTLDFLDKGLRNLHGVVKRQLTIDSAALPGSGAAGGSAYGLKSFFGATYIKGVEFLLQKHKIYEHIRKFDLIITGEGKIDDQTLSGKLVNGISKMGVEFGIPVIGVCGILALNNTSNSELGLQAVYQIHQDERSLQYTIDNARELLTDLACQIMGDFMENT